MASILAGEITAAEWQGFALVIVPWIAFCGFMAGRRAMHNRFNGRRWWQ